MVEWKKQKIQKLYDIYKEHTDELLEYVEGREIRDRENVLYGMHMIIRLLEKLEEM